MNECKNEKVKEKSNIYFQKEKKYTVLNLVFFNNTSYTSEE